jgi:phage terminase large subunit
MSTIIRFLWNKIINTVFITLLNNKDRYLILYGGRGSSKSDFVAKKLIRRCMGDGYFRYILIRNTYATIKDSSYQTIKDIIENDFKVGHLFEFKVQPLEIIYLKNGNKFIARGCDDTTKLKSVKDPTGAWWEEDIPTENDFITVTTGIRTTRADYLQEVFTINPEVEGNYQDNWFWIRFFKGKDSLSFNDVTTIEIELPNKEGNLEKVKVDLTYTVHHSTYKDNKWIPNEFIAFLMDLKRTNPYYWEVYCNGKWGNRILGGLFYKSFNVARNTFNWAYDPSLPLHISFDFNVKPYMSCSVWQIVGKACYLIDEFAMKTPQNSTKGVCTAFKANYFAHKGGLFVYGDPSGRNEDTRSEKGYNDYKIIQSELSMFMPSLRVATLHPPVAMRGNFINEIFANNYGDISINLFENSVYLKNDLLFGKEASDGTKLKEKVKGEDGSTYEKYHHFSDTLDYLICEAFKREFSDYQNGGGVTTRTPIRRSINVNNKY